MPKFNFTVPHQLSAEDAKSRLERLADSFKAKYKDNLGDLQQGWEGDRLSFGFKTFGIKVSGKIDVADDAIAVEGDLPFSAMMFKGKIESEMRQQLERLLK